VLSYELELPLDLGPVQEAPNIASQGTMVLMIKVHRG
jgi:hypothetical protein